MLGSPILYLTGRIKMFQLSGFYFKPSAPDSRSRPKPTAEPWALHSSSYENANHATGGQGAETASQPEMQHSNLDTQIAGSRIWVGPSGFRVLGFRVQFLLDMCSSV